jgi:ABC-2 type transport system permease protein
MVSDLGTAKRSFRTSGDYALLYIPKTELTIPARAILYANSQVNMNVRSYVRNVMVKEIERLKLEAKLRDLQPAGQEVITTDDILRSVTANVDISTIKLGEEGKEEKSFPEVSMILGMFSGILIYFFIFLFGSQVMRGVIEEKTSRIVEVIISSVKPFQLMIGKIVGVGAVGLTQFLLWVVLTTVIVVGFTSSVSSKLNTKQATEQIISQNKYTMPQSDADTLNTTQAAQDESVSDILERINSIDFPVMILSFLFFFLFGYLMYAALFAAVGSAVDSEADTQQFMLPITVPLILAIVLAQYVIQEPQGTLSFWLSIIPLTSPVIMMIRIPFGVPLYEVFMSMGFLVLGFLGTTWLAARIYRTGILMYGKKVNYSELWKWLKY